MLLDMFLQHHFGITRFILSTKFSFELNFIFILDDDTYMLRKARIDAHRVLYHIIARGIKNGVIRLETIQKKRRFFIMAHKVIKTDQAPGAVGPYSQGIVAGNWLFVSGQLGLDPKTGEFAGPDLASQARQAMENLKQIVLAAGYDLDQVVAVDVFLTDMGNFVEFNGIYEKYFSEHRPARAAIEVSALPKGGLVEIKCIVCSDSC